MAPKKSSVHPAPRCQAEGDAFGNLCRPMFLGRVLAWLVAVGHGRMVVLVLVAGGQVCPVLAAAEMVGHMGVFVVMYLRIVAVLLAPGRHSSRRLTGRSVAQRPVESLTSPLPLPSESLSLPESEASLSSPLSPPGSEESASSPVSPSLTVAPPCAPAPGQTVLISSSSSWVMPIPMARPRLRGGQLPDMYHPRELVTPYVRETSSLLPRSSVGPGLSGRDRPWLLCWRRSRHIGGDC